MVDRMTDDRADFCVGFRRRLYGGVIAAMGLIGGVSGVHAQQSLLDPTRPPTAESVAPVSAGSSSKLQSIKLPKGGKPLAIIDGQQVSIGEKLGDAEVLKITESEVVLKGPEGGQTLKMAPDVHKKPLSERKAPAKQSGGRPERARGDTQ
jgi:MSHA biogenesis protein MshK